MTAAIITVAAGAIGLIVGWFVSGSQRVEEKLTEERRSTYLAFLRAADEANVSLQDNRKALERAAEDAEFICSDQMLNSGRIRKLLAAVGTGTWKDERQQFVMVARYESQRNSYWGRRRRLPEYDRTVTP
jgi:hypothetical protein